MNVKTIKISLVNHTHWDREWYFSDQDSLVLSDVLFKRALEQLENHPEASFVLDGQVSVLEDYIQANPEQLTLVRKLTANGQLKVGPWYTQPDALHVQGESLLRNGIIGSVLTKKFGPRMEIGYLPDTFGFNAQMPVVLSALELNRFLSWRGIDPNKTGGFYFNWKSLGGGKSVEAVDMPQGYGTGMLMEPTHEYVDNRVDAGAEFIMDKTPSANNKPQRILIPVGNDQMSIVDGMAQQVNEISAIGKYSYEMSTYEQFFDDLDFNSLPEYQGELVDPVFARVHRTCGSSRMDIKLAATQLEDKLLHQVEPLMVVASKMGIDLGQGILIAAWRKLLESQAHDSMAGSVVDSVRDDILHRLKQGTEIADGIINTIEKMMAVKLGLSAKQVLIINPLPRRVTRWFTASILSSRNAVVFKDVQSQKLLKSNKVPARDNVLIETPAGSEMGTEPEYFELTYGIKDELPGLGYKVVDFDEVAGDNEEITEPTLEVSISDGMLKIQQNNGTSPKLLELIDDANAGDTYDWSPIEGETVRQIQFVAVEKTRNGYRATAKANLPKDLQSREQASPENTKDFTVFMDVEDDGTTSAKIKLSFINSVADHRLRLRVYTGIKAQDSIASVPFGFIRHQDTQVKDGWQSNYPEMPLDVHPLDNNVTIAQHDESVTVFSKTIKEYWAKEGVLDFTLLATTDQLGKPDLIVRPGRASGDTTKAGHPYIPTPGAEMLNRKFVFELTIQSGNGFNPESVGRLEELQNFVPVTYQLQTLNLFLNRLDNKLQDDLVVKENWPSSSEFLALDTNLVISSVYPSFFHSSSMTLRLMNLGSESVEQKNVAGWHPVTALENETSKMTAVAPMDVVSFIKSI
jgi:alpha-mannosidase